LLKAQLSTSSVNNPNATATAVLGALGEGLLTCSWLDLPAPSVVSAIHALLLLQQRSATATGTAAGAQSQQAEIEQLQKAMLARAAELTVPALLAALQGLLRSSKSMHNSTAAAAAVIAALA
jgi:hypothetical protein